MGETRVNLKHLLEDLRDGYPCPIHEAVLTELVANALDSGASHIRIRVAYDPPRLEFVDNGVGMSRRQLITYHDIAATGKQRGQGIGFAGVGAKLSLLISREVVTETRKDAHWGATRWWLESPTHAPWTRLTPPGLLDGTDGTAVRLMLAALDSPLLDPDEIRRLLLDHFEPLFDPDLSRFLYLYYPGGVRVDVDGQHLVRAPGEGNERVGSEVPGRRGAPVGMATVETTGQPLAGERQGLAVSVLGKVVKRGWEWLGLNPEHPELVTGVVEIPSLVSILTTNKADFLRDASSLQRFYTVRKAVQQTVSALLQDMGELPGQRPRARDLRPVEREVGQVLDHIIGDFPELEPLLSRSRDWDRVAALVRSEDGRPGRVGTQVAGGEQATLPGLDPGQGDDPEALPEAGRDEALIQSAEGDATGSERTVRRRRPGLRLAWVEDAQRQHEVSWLEGSILAINRAHPAFARARGPAAERLYLVTAIALALGRELEAGHDPLRFVGEFLGRWGER